MSDLAVAAAWGSALALGRAGSLPAPGSWDLVLRVAAAERLLPLVWTRSGAVLRQQLGAADVARWRAGALTELAAAERRSERSLRIVRLLRGGGVDAVLLRGPGLSERLYGSAALRPGGDVDVLIDAREWASTDALLRGAGWAREYGMAPMETAYRIPGERAFAVEVHCALDDSPLMRHLRLPPPEWSERAVNGALVRVHDGALLPAYLAAHAAKHVLPPLLWFVDLHTLWGSLGEAEREAAWAMARRHRLARHLDWGLARAAALSRLADGDVGESAATLGLRGTERTDVHNAWRMARLSESPVDAVRVVGAWALPHDQRHPTVDVARRLVRRLAKRPASVVRKAREYDTRDAAPPARAIALDEPLHALVRDVTAHGGALWVRATGNSMRPTIAPGTRVRLAPIATVDALEIGTVVLARLPNGVTVLHRVVARDGERVALRGDNMRTADPWTSRADVLAVADLLEIDGEVRPVGRNRRAALRRARWVLGRAARAVGIRPWLTRVAR